MKKAILISIQPKWGELIASGHKTIEVRKTVPKLEAPFKCYIYMTATKERCKFWEYITAYQNEKGEILDGSQKVIGEFVCDRIETYHYGNMDYPTPAYDDDESVCTVGDGYYITSGELEETCLTYEELEKYGKGKSLYGWHISDLVIYDKPRELGEFWVRSNHPDCDLCAHVPVDMSPGEFVWHNDFCGECHRLSYKSMWATHFKKRITRAPQSWMYCQPIEAN